MTFISDAIIGLKIWVPFILTLFGGTLYLFLFYQFIQYRARTKIGSSKIYFQLALFFQINLLLLILILITPLTDTLKGQLIGLLGISFTAALALSSTTFLGNIMAGLMLKALGKYRPGDFLSIEGHFGRVTEIGLLHTEIQTPDRDLTTLPNIYLVTNATKVIRASGTVISEDITIGYDIHHRIIEKSLLKAAKDCGLEEPFMHIQKLGDYSVTYRISGFLKEIKKILSTKAKLREEILDSLHNEKIEIMSPAFMNQRVFSPDKQFIPLYAKDSPQNIKDMPEDIIFDKAEKAESIVHLKQKIDVSMEEVKNIETDEALTNEVKEKKVKSLKQKIGKIKTVIEKKESEEE